MPNPAAGLPRLWTFRASPFAGKARVAFAEKGVEVELVEIHPVKRPPRLRELNHVNRVPVLELDGMAVRESSIICEWLEETHPEPPLWPADPMLRAWARGWAKYLDDAPTTSFFLGLRKRAFGADPEDPDDVVERLHARLARHWPVLDRALAVHDGPVADGRAVHVRRHRGDGAGRTAARVGPRPAAHRGGRAARRRLVRSAARAPERGGDRRRRREARGLTGSWPPSPTAPRRSTTRRATG